MQQGGHRDVPAVTGRTEHRLARHPDVGEEDLVELRVAGDLPQRTYLDARGVHVDEQVGQPAVLLGLGVGTDDEDAPVGDVRPARPHLLAVDDPLVAVEDGPGLRPGKVGAAAGLGEALAPDLLAGQQRSQVALLLLVAAPRDDRRTGHAEPDAADVVRRADPWRSPRGTRPAACTAPAAAVLLGPGQPDVTGVVERPAPLPAVGLVRSDRRSGAGGPVVGQRVAQPGAQLGAKCGLIGGVPEVHADLLVRPNVVRCTVVDMTTTLATAPTGPACSVLPRPPGSGSAMRRP